MKLTDLEAILRSERGNIQFAIVYDSSKDEDLETGCSLEYAVKNYGDKEVKRISAYDSKVVITV